MCATKRAASVLWSEEEVTVCDSVCVGVRPYRCERCDRAGGVSSVVRGWEDKAVTVCVFIQVYVRTGASGVTERAALVLWSEDGRIKL